MIEKTDNILTGNQRNEITTIKNGVILTMSVCQEAYELLEQEYNTATALKQNNLKIGLQYS